MEMLTVARNTDGLADGDDLCLEILTDEKLMQVAGQDLTVLAPNWPPKVPYTA